MFEVDNGEHRILLANIDLTGHMVLYYRDSNTIIHHNIGDYFSVFF